MFDQVSRAAYDTADTNASHSRIGARTLLSKRDSSDALKYGDGYEDEC